MCSHRTFHAARRAQRTPALHAVCSTPYFVCACDRRGLPGHATIGYAHMCSRPTPQRIRLVPSEIRSRHWSGRARTRTRQPAGAAAAAARGGPDRCHRVEQRPRRAAVLRNACARFCAESERRGRALRKQRNLSQNLRFGQGAGAAAASAHCPSSYPPEYPEWVRPLADSDSVVPKRRLIDSLCCTYVGENHWYSRYPRHDVGGICFGGLQGQSWSATSGRHASV